MHLVLANSTRVAAGAERFVLDAAVGLAARGHRISVLGYPGSPLLLEAEHAGLATWGVRTRADSAPWTVLPLALRFARNRVDALLTTYEKDLRTAGWAARLARRPIAVVHSRECDVPLKTRPHYRWHYSRVPHLILANSEATRTTTLGSAPWLDPDRVRVVPKAVDLSRFALRPVVAGPRPRIGFAGQLVPRKRCELLLRQLARPGLLAREWELEIAGQGADAAMLASLATQILPGRVRFCGQITDMPDWLATLDLLVLPSLVEGFGYVLAEAAAVGRPVVGMHSSSAPEVVVDGVTGLLADPTDHDGLGHAIATLLDDPGRRAQMGLAAAEHARTTFALSTMVDRLEDALRYALALARPAPAQEASA